VIQAQRIQAAHRPIRQGIMEEFKLKVGFHPMETVMHVPHP
jgi:hypothetical protein